MLAKNKSGWELIEYIDIKEEEICHYENVTGAYAILKVADQYVIGYNSWRQQWEFPAGGIDAGETPRQAAIKELFEYKENDEMSEIRLWDMQDDIGYVDECDVKIAQIVFGL